MTVIGVIVITRRHIGGIPNVNRDWVILHKPENSYAKVIRRLRSLTGVHFHTNRFADILKFIPRCIAICKMAAFATVDRMTSTVTTCIGIMEFGRFAFARPSSLLLLVVCFCRVNAYPDGAPDLACSDMLPHHSDATAQNSAPPYQITTSKTAYSPGQSISGIYNYKYRMSQKTNPTRFIVKMFTVFNFL